MSRIEEVFLLVRDTLNDHDKARWTDATLLRNLNLAIKDIALQAKLFKNSIAIPLVNGRSVYTLPDNILAIRHCTYNWKPLPLRSSGWMDANREVDWRYRTTDNDITQAVFDEVRRREIRVFPRPFGAYDAVYTASDSLYGVTVGITDHTIDSPYGVVETIVDPEIEVESSADDYGVLAGISVADAIIAYITECPAPVVSISQDPPIDSCFDTALKYFICGTALRNNIDVENRSMANEEFVFYQRDLDIIIGIASGHSVSTNSEETHYNGIG